MLNKRIKINVDKVDKLYFENNKMLYRLMRKTTVPCACGCKHFKEVRK